MTIAQAHRTAAKHHPRHIALFGGSFDPIHNGHLSVARAADRRFNFDEIHFIAASRPPHKLKQHLAIPILATEYAPGGLTAYAPWLTHQATDYLRGDVAVKGGISALVKAAHLAEAFHMNYEVHHGGNSLNNVANLHVIMAIKNCEFFEVLLPAGAQKYGLTQDIEVDRQGLVHAFNGPGLGASIDWALIERKKVAVLA